jgi:cell division protein FtsQ
MSATDPEDELDAEGLEEGEESPFRRRARPVRVRRRRFSQRAAILAGRTVVGLALLAPLGYGGYRLVSYALNSPRFQLTSPEDVVIEGSHYVSREEVLNALGLPLSGRAGSGANIFRLSLERERRQLESLAWVKSATLQRAYPNRLVVHIVERTPVAFANVGGQVKLVDRDGVLLEKPERADFAFPVIDGLESADNPDDRRARLSLFETFMEQMKESAASGWVISEVNLSDAEDLQALLVEGRDTILVHFGQQDFASRFQEFLKLLPDLRASNSSIYSVDLRYRGQVVVNPKPEASRNAPPVVQSEGKKP